MNITVEIRLVVRQRANFACEYCSVLEHDAGGELTIDHFRPQTRGGTDELDNLIYCCQRCNQYKAGYWPVKEDVPQLWNPRDDTAAKHFLFLADGTLYPITSTGTFTLQRLRLNRQPLIAYRKGKYLQIEQRRLLVNYRDIVALLSQLYEQQAVLLEEQQRLLDEQRLLIQLLLNKQK